MRRHICLTVALAVGMGGEAFAQPGTGNLSVLQVGDGSAALNSMSRPVFIQQFTITGSSVGTITIPSTGVNALTLTGNGTSEGALSLSSDGQFLTFAAYNVAAGTNNVTNTTGAVAPRSVGRVDFTNTLTRSSLGTAAYSGGIIRSAVSTNGTDVWTTGSNQGIQYHAFGSGTASGQLSATPTDVRTANIINGQLYTSSITAPFIGINTVGTGLPTTTGQTTTNRFGSVSGVGTPSPLGYVGVDNPLNPFVGLDTMYVADERTAANGGGIQRWSFDGTTLNWNLTGTVGDIGTRHIVASIVGNAVSLFATTAEQSGNRLITVSDLLSPTGGLFGGGFVNIATAPATTAFRGISFTPVPEPATALAVSLSAVGIAHRFRRRKPA